MPPASSGQALSGFGGFSCSHIWHLRSPWLPVPELNRAAGSGCEPQSTGASDFLGAWAAAESPWVFCFHKTPLKDSKSHHALIREKFENKEEHDSAMKNHHSFLQLSRGCENITRTWTWPFSMFHYIQDILPIIGVPAVCMMVPGEPALSSGETEVKSRGIIVRHTACPLLPVSPISIGVRWIVPLSQLSEVHPGELSSLIWGRDKCLHGVTPGFTNLGGKKCTGHRGEAPCTQAQRQPRMWMTWSQHQSSQHGQFWEQNLSRISIKIGSKTRPRVHRQVTRNQRPYPKQGKEIRGVETWRKKTKIMSSEDKKILSFNNCWEEDCQPSVSSTYKINDSLSLSYNSHLKYSTGHKGHYSK